MARFIRTLALSATALCVCLTATAEAKPRAPAPVAEPASPSAPAVARPALWKVSDADTTIYLFGTIHALPPGIKWLEGPVAKAMASSQTLVTEIPHTDPAAMQSVVAQMALLPAGENLHALLPPADRPKLDKALKDAGLPTTTLDRFKPWYAGVLISLMPLIKQGYTAENGVEPQLEARAKELGQVREGLETPAYQLGLFDSLPRKVQLKYLHQVLQNLPTMAAELGQLVQYWKVGNADKLAALMNRGEDDPQMVKVLLVNRNTAWAKWVKARMDKPGTVFMAVGAGHLAGKDSVQAQLAAKGLRAVRIQ
ncbi:MAG: TraB/GumN family protein [Novosphingobium sp.]